MLFRLNNKAKRDRYRRVIGIPMDKKADDIPEVEYYKTKLDIYFKFLFAIGCVLLVLGILGNLTVLLVLSNSKKQKKSFSTFLIMHLSVSDLIFRAIGLYALIMDTTKSMPLFHCRSLTFFQYGCCACVFALLSGIAIDRFFHIIHPLKSLHFKPRKVLLIGCLWVYSAVVSIPFILSAEPKDLRRRFWLQHKPNFTRQSAHTSFLEPFHSLSNFSNHNITNVDVDPGQETYVALGEGTLEGQIAITTYFVLIFIAPLFIMGYSYGRIFKFLTKEAAVKKISAPVARSKIKAVKMLVVVVLSFLCSWGPILVFDLLHTYRAIRDDFMDPYPGRPLFHLLCYTSSIMNPVIYAFNDSSFRKTSKSIIRKWNVPLQSIGNNSRRARK